MSCTAARIGCQYGRSPAGWCRSRISSPEIAKYKDKVANYAVRDMTYNGKLYGLPYYADLITFQYNSKILADHGIAMPQDWDQVLDACLKLKQAGMEKPFVYEYDQTLPNFYQAFVSQGAHDSPPNSWTYVRGLIGSGLKEDAETRRVDGARVELAQPSLMDEAIARIAPQVPGQTDVYAIGIAGWAEQDVFIHVLLGALASFGKTLPLQDRVLIVHPRCFSFIHPSNRALDSNRAILALGCDPTSPSFGRVRRPALPATEFR